jgi:hypothetical protein
MAICISIAPEKGFSSAAWRWQDTKIGHNLLYKNILKAKMLGLRR